MLIQTENIKYCLRKIVVSKKNNTFAVPIIVRYLQLPEPERGMTVINTCFNSLNSSGKGDNVGMIFLVVN